MNKIAYFHPLAVLGKKYLGADLSSFGRQQRLSEITIEPIKNGGLAKIWGPVPPSLNIALLVD